MKKLLIISALILAFGCKKEAALEPSNYDKNRLIVHDSEDPIDHRIYEIYKDTGIPIFYNDSVSSEERMTPAGVKYMYTERLKVFYRPGSTPPRPATNNFILVDEVDKDTLKHILGYLQTKLLPMIPAGFHVPSILLVKTLRTSNDPSTPTGALTSLYGGFNTIVISKAVSYYNMSVNAKKTFENELITIMVANNMTERYADWLAKEFYSITENKAGTIVVYTVEEKPKWLALKVDYCDKFKPVLTPSTAIFYGLGFIREGDDVNNASRPERMQLPKKSEDLKMFINDCFFVPKAEFTEKFKDYDVILRKYSAIREKLLEMGFKLT